MTLAEYQTLTGTTVPAAQIPFVTAQLARTQSFLEGLLGYTLTPADVNDNQYVEIGKTSTDCPSSYDVEDLLPPDAVVFAYRLFPYNKKDVYLAIDPATAVHKVKLVKDGVTIQTLDPDEYRLQWKNGLVRFIAQDQCFCACALVCSCCQNVQLAVDATWVWDDAADMPMDLLLQWSDLVTEYSDPKGDIKSETLGSHSYTKFGNDSVESSSSFMAVIKKYAGPNGSIFRATIAV